MPRTLPGSFALSAHCSCWWPSGAAGSDRQIPGTGRRKLVSSPGQEVQEETRQSTGPRAGGEGDSAGRSTDALGRSASRKCRRQPRTLAGDSGAVWPVQVAERRGMPHRTACDRRSARGEADFAAEPSMWMGSNQTAGQTRVAPPDSPGLPLRGLIWRHERLSKMGHPPLTGRRKLFHEPKLDALEESPVSGPLPCRTCPVLGLIRCRGSGDVGGRAA